MHNIISSKLLQAVSCRCLSLMHPYTCYSYYCFCICNLGLKILSVCFSYNQVTDIDIRSESKCIHTQEPGVIEIICSCTYRKYVLNKLINDCCWKRGRNPLHTGRTLPQQCRRNTGRRVFHLATVVLTHNPCLWIVPIRKLTVWFFHQSGISGKGCVV